MKNHRVSNLLVLVLAFLPVAAFAGGPLKTFTGQVSPLQHLSCGSDEVNIRIDVQGDEAKIESNDVPGTYTCIGVIAKTGMSLNCTAQGSGIPAKFELHAGDDLKASFSFTGTPGSASGTCTL